MPVYDDQDTKQKLSEAEVGAARRQKEIDDLEAQFAEENATESGSKKLAEKEKAATDSSPADDLNYTGKKNPKKGRGFWTRRKTVVTGGLLGTIFGAIGLGSFVSLPVSFLHFGQSIAIPNFSAIENFTDSRLGKLYIYSKTKSVGDTRLDYIERAYKGRIFAQMEKMGMKPVTDTRLRTGLGRDYLKYWQLDTNVSSSPLSGLSPDEIKTKLALKEGVVVRPNGQVYIKADSWGKQVKATYELNKLAGYNKVTAALRTRVLAKYFGFTLHPMQNLERKAGAWVVDKTKTTFKEWQKAREASIKRGVTAATIDTTKAQQTDPDGKTTPLEEGTKTKVTPAKFSESIKSVVDSPGGRVGGAALLGLGAVCVANTIADNIDEFKYYQVILPLIRIGMEVVSIKSQIEAGEDIDVTQLDYYSELLEEKDSTGKVLSDWSMAEGITQYNGGTGGVELSSKASLQPGLPDWLAWTENGAVDGLCSTGGQIVAGVVGVTIGVLTAGVTTTVAGAIGGAIATEIVVDKISEAASGEAVSIAAGGEWGAQAYAGAGLAARAQGLQFGGNTVSTTQLAALNEQTAEYEKMNFQDKSLVARIFDTKDRYSFASQLLDSGVLNLRNSLSSMGDSWVNPVRSLGAVLSNLSTDSSVYAAEPVDLGLPTIGISLEDQENPLVENIYENNNYVVSMLNKGGATAQKYIDRAKLCNDVDIKQLNGAWRVIPTEDPEAFRATVTTEEGQDPSCNTPSSVDPDWLRFRFFVADSAIIDSWACMQGDDVSCATSGYGDVVSTTTETTTASTSSGLDFTELKKDSTSTACAEGTNDLGIQDGYSRGTLVKIRVCAIPGFKSGAPESDNLSRYYISGANGNVVVNARVSGAWKALYEAAKADGITLSATAGGGFRSMQMQSFLKRTLGDRAGAPGYSNHQMGLAIDIGGISGYVPGATCDRRARSTSKNYVWMNANAADFGFRQLAKEAWHWDPDTASYNCLGDG